MVRISLVTSSLLLAGSFLLAGCGIKGDLATPPPVFGSATSKPDVDAGTVGSPDDTLIDTEEVDDDEGPFYGPDFEDDFGEED